MAPPEVTGRKTGRRLLDYQALKDRGIPWTRIHLGRLEAAGKFPQHINVGDNSIAWFEDEIDDFLEAKAADRNTKVLAHSENGPQPDAGQTATVMKGRFRRQHEKQKSPDG